MYIEKTQVIINTFQLKKTLFFIKKVKYISFFILIKTVYKYLKYRSNKLYNKNLQFKIFYIKILYIILQKYHIIFFLKKKNYPLSIIIQKSKKHNFPAFTIYLNYKNILNIFFSYRNLNYMTVKKKKHIFTILKSPHVDKKAREQAMREKIIIICNQNIIDYVLYKRKKNLFPIQVSNNTRINSTRKKIFFF